MRTEPTIDAQSRRKALLAEFLEHVWNCGDAGACDRFIADAYTLHHDPGDPWDGRTLDLAGYKQRLAISRAPFPDQRFELQAMLEDGDTIAIPWLWSATHAGDLPGFPATGKRVTMSGATLYVFDADDKLTGHWQITDRLGVYQQLQQNRRQA
jgi:predicted ester cyclase